MVIGTRSGPRGLRLLAWLMLIPTLGMLAFAFFVPMIVFMRYGFAVPAVSALQPTHGFTFSNFAQFFGTRYLMAVVWQTIWMSALVAVLSLLVGYLLAFAMWRATSPGIKLALAIVVFLPLLTSSVVRAYGWEITLSDSGPVNSLLRTLALTSRPLSLLYAWPGVVIAMVHMFLPFTVFPLYNALEAIDREVTEAAADLGATGARRFSRVILPMTRPGLIAATELCFTLALGSYVVPALLGGGRVQFLSVSIYNNTSSVNWPLASVQSITLLLLAFVVVVGLRLFGRTKAVAR